VSQFEIAGTGGMKSVASAGRSLLALPPAPFSVYLQNALLRPWTDKAFQKLRKPAELACLFGSILGLVFHDSCGTPVSWVSLCFAYSILGLTCGNIHDELG
jgi:hypothetical protein